MLLKNFKMRKLLFAFLFTTLINFNLKAQESSEISVGVGDGVTYELFFEFEGLINGLIPSITKGHYFTEDVSVSTPYIFLDYRRPVSDRMKLGAQIGYYAYKGTSTEYSFNREIYEVYDVKRSAFVIMPGLDYTYYQRNKFKFYGNVMAGVGITNSEAKGTMNTSRYGEDNNVIFAFQVNPIGLSYGENFKFFAEGGLGFSIVNAGIRFKL